MPDSGKLAERKACKPQSVIRTVQTRNYATDATRALAERMRKYILMIDCTLLACLLNITPFFGQSGDMF